MIRTAWAAWLLLAVSATLLEAKSRPEASGDCAPSETSVVDQPMESAADSSIAIPSNGRAMAVLEELEMRLSRLERRLRAVEQPDGLCGRGLGNLRGRTVPMSTGNEVGVLLEARSPGPPRGAARPARRLETGPGRQSADGAPQGHVFGHDATESSRFQRQLDRASSSESILLAARRRAPQAEQQFAGRAAPISVSEHAESSHSVSDVAPCDRDYGYRRSLRPLLLSRDASSNNLRTLPESLFLTTSSLVLLDLSCNSISSLTSGTFRGLIALEELLLGRNRLAVLPVDLFADLSKLRYLGLEENRLKELPSELFRAQLSLRELNTRGNQLTEISANLLSPLRLLRSLEMSSNKIVRIDPSAFRGLAALRELELGHNRIRNLTPGLFASAATLERLVLYANGIESLPRGAFRGLSNLTSLFLHSNHLRSMHPELFQDTPNLRKLQLESNYLSMLPPRILDPVPFIEQLRLARNPWHCDCAASYLAMWLQRMYLARTNGSSATDDSGVWEFGAGAVCRGPGTLGGKLLLRLTFHELCEGQWASMRGLVPRLPVQFVAGGSGRVVTPPTESTVAPLPQR